jgi:BON domain
MKRHLWVGVILLALFAAGCARLGVGSRSDQQIASDVQNKINSDTAFPDKGLNVNASNGVVTLSGTVSSDAARNAAANDAAAVEGVKTVVNNLQVAPAASAASSDLTPPEFRNSNDAAAVPAPRVAAAKPSPRTSARSARGSGGSGSQAGSSQDNSGDNGLRTTVPPTTATTAANDTPTTTAPATPPPPQPISVPAGTQLAIRLVDELSSETAQVGDVFHATISTPVTVGDTTVIPMTSNVEGRVVDVKSAGRFKGQSDLVIELTRLQMNGKSYTLSTDRWSKAGSSRGKATAAKVGGGAAVGAILGGIFGGGKGAAIGAAAGAGAGTGVSAATKGQQIILKPETVLNFQLQNSVAVLPPSGGRQPMNPNPTSN